MSVVWTSIIIVCLGMLLVTNPAIAFSSILSGAEKTIALSLKLWGIYAVWLGILNIIQETGLDKKIAKLLSPLIDRLIGKTDADTKGQIAINITGNLLGIGNASTPSGIEGMARLDRGSEKITAAMAMFFILNTASIQLIPSTLIGLRTFAGSESPNDIILPMIISSFSGVIAGIIMIKLCAKIFRKRENKKRKVLSETQKKKTLAFSKNTTRAFTGESKESFNKNLKNNFKSKLKKVKNQSQKLALIEEMSITQMYRKGWRK